MKRILGGAAALQSAVPMKGGASSAVFRLQTASGERFVLRLFTNREWLAKEPDLALHEAEALKAAAKTGVPVPQLVAFDPEGSACGYPAVLMTHLEGKVILQPQHSENWLSGLAESLARIHASDSTLTWRYFTYNDVNSLTVPQWSGHRGIWEKALELVRKPPQTKARFIHRDYHPTNVLWKNDAVSGIVDWVNACTGPAGIDIGHCRLNLSQLYGTEAADRFLLEYMNLTNDRSVYDPYWDLLSLIEFLPGPPQVYKGWTDLQVSGISAALLVNRIDEYLLSVMSRV